jgi:hypothetical protein
VAVPSEAENVFAGWNTGIVGSNAARGIDVSPRLFCAMCPRSSAVFQIHSFDLILNGKRPGDLIGQEKDEDNVDF